MLIDPLKQIKHPILESHHRRPTRDIISRANDRPNNDQRLYEKVISLKRILIPRLYDG